MASLMPLYRKCPARYNLEITSFFHYRTRMTFISLGKGQWVKRGCVLPNLEILGGVRHIKNASVVRVLASGPRGPTLTLRQHNTLFPNKTRGNF